ncbi:MAG: DEAD/DEAH box helicase [Desulfobacteraceae bacterium]|nr:DEAD/DEAH box helicase [Desulfobacteraceae bacterium]
MNVVKEKLHRQLDDIDTDSSPANAPRTGQDYAATKDRQGIPIAANQKIALFRSLFRGRDDVYARFWMSRKTGKSGYSPVCKNEWTKGICKKPVIRCSECPNREFLPFTDNVIHEHLAGMSIIGVYPMLSNENCYFLAVDFDKEHWREDVSAFRQTCQQERIPTAVERSRSGNGAHVWIFFEEEVSASLARRMGCFLITKTMERRYQLNMRSYDRLFPNQDTLPKGGFGNLIALPFQREAMSRGNTVFIDEKGIPYRNQWLYLSSLKKMPPYEVEAIAKEASKTGQIVGVRLSPVSEEDLPWMRLPSGKRKYKPQMHNLPELVNLVIAERIYIKVADIPSILLNQLKQLAAFQNPEFYRRQKMRLSVYATPRIICCAELVNGYLALPRGCLADVCCVLNDYNVKVELDDKRIVGRKIRAKFQGELTKQQKGALRVLLKAETGVVVAPPGSGKTVLAVAAISRRKANALILVHRKPLMDQWRLSLSSFLGMELKQIGRIGGGYNKPSGVIDIAMIQSMERKGIVDDRIADYGFIVVDECHHIAAFSFERVLTQAKAKYVLGLTATPYRRDGHQPIIHMQCGQIVHQIKQKDIKDDSVHYHVITRNTDFDCGWTEESNIYDLWPQLIADAGRNIMIVEDIKAEINRGRFPIILTERREHLEILREMLEPQVDPLIVLHGGVKKKRCRELLGELRKFPNGNGYKAILATGAFIGEGFDDPRLDTLFVAMPVSFRGKVVQYAGRLHRAAKGKNQILIFDYLDVKVPVCERMYERRCKAYKSMGYTVQKEGSDEPERTLTR